MFSFEATGPHCHTEGHRDEDVIGLGECGEIETQQLDDLMVEQTGCVRTTARTGYGGHAGRSQSRSRRGSAASLSAHWRALASASSWV